MTDLQQQAKELADFIELEGELVEIMEETECPRYKESANLLRRIERGELREVEPEKPMQMICPRCGRVADHDPYFGCIVCRQCGWTDRNLTGAEKRVTEKEPNQ